MHKVSVYDEYKLTSRTKTPEGYLEAPAIIARAGVQYYLASELGLDKAPFNLPSNKVIALNRPPEEVFHPESMKSFEHKPITIDHPPKGVDSKNWKSLSVGDMSGIHQDTALTDHLAADRFTIRDHDAVEAVESGKKALSNGYDFNLEYPSPGKLPDGTVYDGVQRTIRGNHSAIVDAARGGERCNIADAQFLSEAKQEITHMPDLQMRIVTIDSVPVEIAQAGADVVSRLVARDTANTTKLGAKIKVIRGQDAKKVSAMPDDMDDPDEDDEEDIEVGDAAKVQGAYDALKGRLKRVQGKVLSQDALTALVEARVDTITKAKDLMPKIVIDKKTNVELQREAVTHVITGDSGAKIVVESVLAGKPLATADEATVQTVFNVVAATAKKVATGDSSVRTSDNRVADALLGTDVNRVNDNTTKLVGRAAYLANLNQTKK